MGIRRQARSFQAAVAYENCVGLSMGAAIIKGTLQPSRTFEFPETVVKAIREQFGLSQIKFAHLVGISVGTLRNWEQGRRRPEGPARVQLQVAAKHPEALLDISGQRPAKKQRITTRRADGKHGLASR